MSLVRLTKTLLVPKELVDRYDFLKESYATISHQMEAFQWHQAVVKFKEDVLKYNPTKEEEIDELL